MQGQANNLNQRVKFIKFIPVTLSFFGLFSCHHRLDNSAILQTQVDSLEKKLAATYKPGFGEFMSSIQTHHAKLWFAEQHDNWRLADFEIHEMMEAIENIEKYQIERKESRMIKMINPSIDKVSNAIKQKDPTSFKRSYVVLTNTCNECHRAADFDFNVVKIPEIQTFSNQDFDVNTTK